MARVFISHSSRDNAEADALFAWLKARGFAESGTPLVVLAGHGDDVHSAGRRHNA